MRPPSPPLTLQEATINVVSPQPLRAPPRYKKRAYGRSARASVRISRVPACHHQLRSPLAYLLFPFPPLFFSSALSSPNTLESAHELDKRQSNGNLPDPGRHCEWPGGWRLPAHDQGWPSRVVKARLRKLHGGVGEAEDPVSKGFIVRGLVDPLIHPRGTPPVDSYLQNPPLRWWDHRHWPSTEYPLFSPRRARRHGFASKTSSSQAETCQVKQGLGTSPFPNG